MQGTYSLPIPPEPGWRASTDPGVRLSPPEPAAPDRPRESARLPQAQTVEPPVASVPSPPRMSGARDADGALPVDIPQFAQARPRVAAGQQPYPDGVSWLQANGYRTVLHVHRPGEDVSAARRQFEKKGLKYLDLEVSPATLNRAVVDRFSRIVTDESNLPLFVYDRDSALAGGLWYLHFRLVDRLPDDRARTEAGRLGFKEDRDNDHRTMWIAIQNLLKSAGPR